MQTTTAAAAATTTNNNNCLHNVFCLLRAVAVVKAPTPSSTMTAAAAAVLAGMMPSSGKSTNHRHDKLLNDSTPSTQLMLCGDWRNEVDDRPLRQCIMMHMIMLLNKPKMRRSCAQWRRMLPAIARLFEAAHYQVSPSRQAYSNTLKLEEHVGTLTIAFQNVLREYYVEDMRRGSESSAKKVEKTPPDRIGPLLNQISISTRRMSSTENGDDHLFEERLVLARESLSRVDKMLPRSFSELSLSKIEKQQGEDNHLPYGSKVKASFQTQETEDTSSVDSAWSEASKSGDTSLTVLRSVKSDSPTMDGEECVF